MNVKKIELQSNSQTANEMRLLINRFYTDLTDFYTKHGNNFVKISDLNLNSFFDFVKNIPYRVDDFFCEIVARPKIILKNLKNGADCKKKTILMGSWAKCNGFPFRLIGSSNRIDQEIHHVFPEIFIKKWIRCDATYPENILGVKNFETFSKSI